MEQVGCKECTSVDCHGCNLLRLEQMLKFGKFDALMDEKRRIKTGIDVRPVVRGEWIYDGYNSWRCSACNNRNQYAFRYSLETRQDVLQDYYCPRCGANMLGKAGEHCSPIQMERAITGRCEPDWCIIPGRDITTCSVQSISAGNTGRRENGNDGMD